ncbi:MAG: glycosyltransferase family 4 protein [Chloroflexota bacterium]
MSNRILMLIENASFPRDNRVRPEAYTLKSAGYDVTVICPVGQDKARYELVNGVHVYRYPAPPEGEGLFGFIVEYSFAMLWTFVLSLYVWTRHGFDVIHSHNPPDLFVFLALFYKLFGKKYIFDHHDLTPEVYQAKTPLGGNAIVHRVLIEAEKLSCRVADHVIATNESYKKLEIERSGIPESKVTVVRNAPDSSHLQQVAPDPELRQKASSILCYIGEMAYQDGIDYLLRAFNHLRYKLNREDFYCVLLGTGSELDKLKELATELQLNDHVWFYGWANGPELSLVLSSSDICVDPDPSNPFNDRSTMVKMTEYMALGKPIVAFDLPEHRFTAQGAAIYVKDNNEFEFAQAIERLMDSPELRNQMGMLGRERIETKLSWKQSSANLLDVYSIVLPLSAQLEHKPQPDLTAS